ncbi:hypothetical protein COV82_03200 [Candidatus Peregrinibacteria bacterium CG11_big_fil_rev_8_21_14_0_20_46_8]|nr:MAG: hypothetical protein COV82_03200 [Candidatus Peregrinibacteria bacterium CG11_big_fil_rev_8_21_14_0_20_46_8]
MAFSEPSSIFEVEEITADELCEHVERRCGHLLERLEEQMERSLFRGVEKDVRALQQDLKNCIRRHTDFSSRLPIVTQTQRSHLCKEIDTIVDAVLRNDQKNKRLKTLIQNELKKARRKFSNRRLVEKQETYQVAQKEKEAYVRARSWENPEYRAVLFFELAQLYLKEEIQAAAGESNTEYHASQRDFFYSFLNEAAHAIGAIAQFAESGRDMPYLKFKTRIALRNLCESLIARNAANPNPLPPRLLERARAIPTCISDRLIDTCPEDIPTILKLQKKNNGAQ